MGQNSYAAPSSPLSIVGAKADLDSSRVLPREHWAYACISKLFLSLGPPAPKLYSGQENWTRYEFALFCIRLNDYNPLFLEPTTRDILFTLNQEFAVEIAKLGAQGSFGSGGDKLEPRVAAPPRLIIPPSVRKPGYTSYSDRKFLSSKEAENFKKEAENPAAK